MEQAVIELLIGIIGGVVTFIVLWGIWVTNEIFGMKSDIRANTQDDENGRIQMELLVEKVEEIKVSMNKIEKALVAKQIIPVE